MQKQIYTLVVDFSIEGNLAYLSHQETLTLFERALVRASVPLVYSMGFNPHPHLSIPFPRSVGTQSARDRVCAITLVTALVLGVIRIEDCVERENEYYVKVARTIVEIFLHGLSAGGRE